MEDSMKKIILVVLIGFGSMQADVVGNISKRIDKKVDEAGEKIEKEINKQVQENVLDPLDKKKKELEKYNKEQKELLKKNSEKILEEAVLALWVKIKGFFKK